MKNKIDYGNWISSTKMKKLYGRTIIICTLSALSFLNFNTVSVSDLWRMKVIRAILLIIAILQIIKTIYIVLCRNLFDYDKGRVSDKIVNMVLSRLKWNGKGKLLDIGCGSGALTIKSAKKYRQANVTGIDYWDDIWNFKKEQCENNAILENVSNRCKFIHGDAAKLPFSDESFDAAVSNFVFHEVQTQPNKQLVVREALRVVKKGGCFAFHDYFYKKNLYGDIETFVNQLKDEGISEIKVVRTTDEPIIHPLMKTNIMLNDIGMIYGVK